MDKNKIVAMPNFFKFRAKDANGNEVRCMKEDDEHVFVYAKGKKRSGWRHSLYSFCMQYELIETQEKDETASWRRRMKNVVKVLTESGLWPEIKEQYENLLAWGLTLEEKKAIHSLYWDVMWSWKNGMPAEAEEKIAGYSKKYPEIVYKGEDGKWCFDTNYLFELSDCTTKSMYFGKWDNVREKKTIAGCIADKQPYACQHQVSYDVSFQYDPRFQKAWYSEEYRGCGNGHYYLACNHSLALFYEND